MAGKKVTKVSAKAPAKAQAKATPQKVKPVKKTSSKKVSSKKSPVTKKVAKKPARMSGGSVMVVRAPQMEKPKRPLNTYMKFVILNRPKIVKSKPNLSAKEVCSELGAKWRKLSDAEKAKFQ